jgi:hypothetical protein
MQVDVLPIDEKPGRQEALRRGLKVAGTLSVLDEAAQAGLPEFDAALARLRETSCKSFPIGTGRHQGAALSLNRSTKAAPRLHRTGSHESSKARKKSFLAMRVCVKNGP